MFSPTWNSQGKISNDFIKEKAKHDRFWSFFDNTRTQLEKVGTIFPFFNLYFSFFILVIESERHALVVEI